MPQSQTESPVDKGSATSEERVKFPQNKENSQAPLDAAGGSTNPFIHPAEMPAPPAPAKVLAPTPSILRKPIGPRPMSMSPSSSVSECLPHPPPEAVQPATPPTPEEVRPNLPLRPTLPPLRLDNTRPAQSFDEMRPAVHSPSVRSPVTPSRSPSPWNRPQPTQKPFTPFTLSIIRRDPSTGHQWNIGKVSSFQSTIIYQDPNNPDAEPVVQYPRGYPVIDVHIETSGYARFRDFPTTLPLPKNSRPGSSGAGAAADAAQSMKELAAAMQAQQLAEVDGEGGFRRQVVMSYGKTWTHNLRDALKGRAGGSGNRSRSSTTASSAGGASDGALEPPRAGFHRRQDSGNSTNSNESSTYMPDAATAGASHPLNSYVPPAAPEEHKTHAADDQPQPVLTVPGPGLRPKGYTFQSPWDGRCDFRTSSNGRALKCRHTRNTTSQGFNPLAAAQALRDASTIVAKGVGRARGFSASATGAGAPGSGGDTGRTVAVSELRFNLPAGDLFNSKEDRDRAIREAKEGFGRMMAAGHEGIDDEGYDVDHEDGREPFFDFSALGREKAGGGNRGKRAKLGKLLVHDEGLKMLDLTVASNMGIWWQAWERTF